MTESLTIDFIAGNKDLTLTIDLQTFNAITLVTSIPEANKEIGDITTVYQQAKKAIQNLSQEINHPITYWFSTTNGKMRLWGLNEGNRVFTWDRVRDDGENFAARKLFLP
ncbi:MAG: hypothetical protein Q7R97_00950 [Candidatus Daviesbacteria bacterium]|nr:hypothetical protein [Candidatus Daviesbacteria bacterium]